MYSSVKSLALLAFLGSIRAILAAPIDSDTTANATLVERQDTCTFTGFSGYACDISAGDADPVYGARCIDAEGRHSFELGSGCTGQTTVYFYTEEGCPGDAYIDYVYEGPGCYSVNTGAHWGSSLVYFS